MVGGGQDGHYEWNALNYAEIYDTTTRTWSEGPNLPERIVGHCFINLVGEDDRIMMVGGKSYVNGITNMSLFLTMKGGRSW